jgi:hypothetical protein
MSNIKEHHLKLNALYSSLDQFLEANPNILDNTDNIDYNSNKQRLFDTLEMLESKYSSFSLMDLKIRCVHYIIVQHDLLTKLKTNNNEQINSILVLSKKIIKDLLLPEDLNCIPAYLLNLLTKKNLYKEEKNK